MERLKYRPYSSSRLDVAECPHRFNRQYITKELVDEGSSASNRGNVVHEVFEYILQQKMAKKTPTWAEVEAVLIKKLAEYEVPDFGSQELCLKAVQNFLNTPLFGIETILGTEEKLAVKLVDGKFVQCDYEDPDAYVRGKMDILMIDDNNIATVIDHKTQQFIQDADTFQMGMYAWLVAKCYPYVTAVKTILHFCHPDLNFFSKPHLWDKNEINNVESMIKVRIGLIESLPNHNAVANGFCCYCPIKGECPKLESWLKKNTAVFKLKAKPPLTPQEAQEYAEALHVMTETEKEAKDRLKTFVKAVGPVMIRGVEFSFEPSDSWEVEIENRDALFKLLQKFNMNPYAFFVPSATELKKLWKVLTPEQLKEVQSTLTRKVTTTFKGRKI